MDLVPARPRRGADGLVPYSAEGAGILYTRLPPLEAIVQVSGFTDPSVWILEVGDPRSPGLVFGHTVIEDPESAEVTVYLSPPGAEAFTLYAMEDRFVIEILDFPPNDARKEPTGEE
jgi:hypothetical protein